MKREQFKEVELGGRKWRVGRFDALTGSYIATLLLMQMLPMGLDQQVGLGSLAKGRSLMDRETFLDVQKECLRVCAEPQVVGEVLTPLKVMLDDGRWGVPGLEDDFVTVLSLTIHALVFNVSDFFQEGALTGLTSLSPVLSQLSAKE